MMVADPLQATAPQIVTWPYLGLCLSDADAVEMCAHVLESARLNGEGAERHAWPGVGAMS